MGYTRFVYWEPTSPPSNLWDDSGHPDGGPIKKIDGRGSLDVVLTDSVYHVNGSLVAWAHSQEDNWYHYEEKITEMNVNCTGMQTASPPASVGPAVPHGGHPKTA